MRIGIVGQGYVGTAVRTVFKKHYDVSTYDINKELSTCETLHELVNTTDIVFVCVPTPMNPDGSCNLDIVNSVVRDINKTVNAGQDGKIVAIKSTVPPGTTDRLNKECKNITVIFNPEFLTEANFIEDFKNQNRIIIGGQRPASTKLRQVYSLAFPDATIVKTGSKTAEMVKYMTNTFLATKVSFANEMYNICSRLGIDYDKVVEYSTYDERLGKSHWAVPGPDGKNALIQLGLELDMTPEVLIAAWHTNLEVRPEEDWKELKGRAVVEEK